jgi:SAM-dependent methyltransferase
MTSYEEGLARVAAVWAEQAGQWYVGHGVHWVEHQLVQERLNFKVAGEPRVDRYQYLVKKYLAGRTPLERALTLGCGAGDAERGFAGYNFCREHEAVDISAGAIAMAVAKAREAGLTHIRYRVDDLNGIVLSREHYDVVLGISSVHHVVALERLYEQVAQALKPGGYFFLDEFVGPSQFQWTDLQLAAVNEQIETLPEFLKRSVTNPPSTKQPVVRPTIAFMNAADPSEAIRSAEIVPLLSSYFDVLEIKGQGGSLLHLLLEDIAGNFSEHHAGSISYLRMLFEFEDRLIDAGVLRDDFAMIVARKRL